MELTRRDFLKAAGAGTVVGVLFAGCAIPERELIKQSPRDLPEDLVAGLDDWYATGCGLCADGHGVIVRVVEGRAKKIEGNPDHPINRGKLMARCLAGVQALYHPDRVRTPLLRRAEERGSPAAFQPLDWPQAEQELLGRLRTADPAKTVLITEPLRGHLGHAVRSFAQATGIQHLALEPLEQTVVRQAVKDVFGQDRLPHFDIANAGSVLAIGADFLETWLSPIQYNRAYGEFRQGAGRERGTLIVADARFSMTAANADIWLPVAPGQEGVLALSIAHVLLSDGLANQVAAELMTGGRGAAALAAYAPEVVAQQVSATPGAISVERIREVAHLLAENKRAVVLAGGSAAAQTNGLFNVSAALALNGLLGSVGIKGGILFNPAPPLSELAALGPPATFAQWKELAERLGRGEVDLVLVRGANPAHSLAALGFADSLARARAVVSFATVMDETASLADLVLPDQVYLETWDTDVPDPGPGYPVLTLQQPVVPLLRDEAGGLVYDARAFGDVLLGAGEALGHRMPAPTMEALVRQRLQALHQAQRGRGSIQGATFEAFWVGVLQRGGWWDTKATFDTRFALRLPSEAPAPSFAGPTGDGTYHLLPFPLIAIGDGSAAHLPWPQATPDPLTTAAWKTWVEVNNREARRLGLREGDVVRLESPAGSIEAPVYIHPGVPPTVVGVPLGQGHDASGRYAEGRGQNPFRVLVGATVQDTGALAWAATRVRLSGTGRRVRIPKLEGGFTAVQLEDAHVIELTTT